MQTGKTEALVDFPGPASVQVRRDIVGSGHVVYLRSKLVTEPLRLDEQCKRLKRCPMVSASVLQLHT